MRRGRCAIEVFACGAGLALALGALTLQVPSLNDPGTVAFGRFAFHDGTAFICRWGYRGWCEPLQALQLLAGGTILMAAALPVLAFVSAIPTRARLIACAVLAGLSVPAAHDMINEGSALMDQAGMTMPYGAWPLVLGLIFMVTAALTMVRFRRDGDGAVIAAGGVSLFWFVSILGITLPYSMLLPASALAMNPLLWLTLGSALVCAGTIDAAASEWGRKPAPSLAGVPGE